jgi:predicted nucleic acid-binding protein
MTEVLARASIVYFDSIVFIYFFERIPIWFERARAAFDICAERDASILTSDLTVAECLYRPHKDNNYPLIRIYEDVFEARDTITRCPIEYETLKRASSLGAGWA